MSPVRFASGDAPDVARQNGETDLDECSLLGILYKACAEGAIRIAGWQVKRDLQSSVWWTQVVNDNTNPPEQGWKLHVSASVLSARAVFHRVLPLLFAESVNFKVVSSLDLLHELNSGAGGLSQIGKFITVYPADDAQAVRLAEALDNATRGFRGPAVPSDLCLKPGSLVFYRYGRFDHLRFRTPLGSLVPAIKTPAGESVPDQRSNTYYAPEWVNDPFVAAGIARPQPARSPLVAQRFLITATEFVSPRGAIHLAMDVEDPRICILKEANRDACLGFDGRDARDRLRQEAAVLAQLSHHDRFPAPYALVEDQGSVFLAMEEVQGETLEEHVYKLALQGRFIPVDQLLDYGRQLAEALRVVHENGIIYRDLKPPNVIVSRDRFLRLIDFELAQELSVPTEPSGVGTRGYRSPQQAAGQQPAITDDVYSLGALLYFLATGADPSHAPHPFALLDRPVRLLNPSIPSRAARVIAKCLDPDPGRRFPSMQAISCALTAPNEVSVRLPARNDSASRSKRMQDQHFGQLARRLARSLCRAARHVPHGQGLTWVSCHRASAGTYSHDINAGSAGSLLALAELVSEFRDTEHSNVLAEAAHSLASSCSLRGCFSPGLYVGEAGIGAALLRAGQVLCSDELIEAAVERAHWVSRQLFESPDIFNGAAGRLRFHLLVWDETQDHEQLMNARRAGEMLLSTAEPTTDDGLCWSIPPGHERPARVPTLGYAHGAAGIADALLDLFEVCGDTRYLEAAQGAGRWLARCAVPVLDDHSGLAWPVSENGRLSLPFWCHGATGIGRFFLHLAEAGGLAQARDIAARAAAAVGHARHIGPTQCHGLAGNIEFLLDVYRMTGESLYISDAHILTRLLEAFAEERDGELVWPSESPNTFSPDYMVGYAGVAVCLLRLSAPDRLPHLLTRPGFRNSLSRSISVPASAPGIA